MALSALHWAVALAYARGMDWGPITSVSAILVIACGIAAFMFKRSIQHLLDRELEQLRADLHARDEAINALRAGALSGMAERHRALDARRIQAIENIWTVAVNLEAKLGSASKFTQSLKMDRVIARAEGTSSEAVKMQSMGEMLWKITRLDDALVTPSKPPSVDRLFVTDLAWALFKTYEMMLSYPVAQLGAVRTGMGLDILADTKPMLDMVKAALPLHAAFIDENGVAAFPYLVDKVRDALLTELTSNLADSSADQRTVSRAAEILTAADKISKERIPTDIPADLRK